MKESWRNVLGFLATGLLAILSAPASAQLSTTANGPYYATPSWDQKLTTGRFVILSNWNGEAVLDRETGLVWERSPDASLQTQEDASGNCQGLTKGGRMGWRLPTVQELSSLLDPTVPSAPALPIGHPFGNVVAPFSYWSATTSLSDSSRGVSVNFVKRVVVTGPNSQELLFWCVRGGQGPDAQ